MGGPHLLSFPFSFFVLYSFPFVVLIGLISDTHGLLRPAVHGALAGVDMILHAGDVGGDEILMELSTIAPVRAVYGNTDPPGAARLVARIDDVFDGVRVHVSHGHELGAPRTELLLAAYDADVLVYGHTHKALIHRATDGRLVVNPGAAGPARFDVVPTVARMLITDGSAEVKFVPLA
jgi:putative phosphoesterase